MWLVPGQMPTLRVDRGAVTHLIGGADLMAPGVQDDLESLSSWEEGDFLAVADSNGM